MKDKQLDRVIEELTDLGFFDMIEFSKTGTFAAGSGVLSIAQYDLECKILDPMVSEFEVVESIEQVLRIAKDMYLSFGKFAE